VSQTSPKYPRVPAAFINAISEEGTKAEAVAFLQEQWNENCSLRAELKALRGHFATRKLQMIAIDKFEVLALKKLVLINHALAKSLSDPMASREQKALVSILNEVVLRADLDNQTPRSPKHE